MIKWKRSNNVLEDVTEKSAETTGFFSKITQGLSKTRKQLGSRVLQLLRGSSVIDTALWDELESILISADVGVETTRSLLHKVQTSLTKEQLQDGVAVCNALKEQMCASLTIKPNPVCCAQPLVILMVGVNGAGKTTLIGKLAKMYQQAGKKVMLAAGDTFRAAAVEQLEVWGARHNITVIAQHTGADSASVIFDAFQAAKARGIDVLIADTAGRLHTQYHLMEELKKIKRVLQKIDKSAPHETMLVLDASIGQNALTQARQFHADIGVTSISMTKLDGTAKGGILFAIAHVLAIPFSYLGVGETALDLQPFNAREFVDALFAE